MQYLLIYMCLAYEPEPFIKRVIKEEPKSYGRKAIEAKLAPPMAYESPETTLFLESFYYGCIVGDVPNESATAVEFRSQVSR